MFNSGGGITPVMNVDGNRDGAGWGGDGWWVLIILFALFGGWGNGWGGNGANGTQSGFTDAAVQRGFDNQTIVSKLDGISNGICDASYAALAQSNEINTNILQTGFGITNAIQSNAIAGMQQANALQAQLADCCCENRAAIAQVRYDMATNTCAITNGMQQGFAQIDRTISDKFCDLEMKQMQRTIDEQQNLINALNLAQSQANQTQQIIDTVRPCPTPSYLTCNPWATNGTAYTGCCNVQPGCGC